MRFYLAGKIGRSDWRHDIVTELNQTNRKNKAGYTFDAGNEYEFEGRGYCFGLPETWPVWENTIFGQHDYVGPFFTPSVEDANCYFVHGRNHHGNSLNNGAMCANDFIEWREACEDDPLQHHIFYLSEDNSPRMHVINLCHKALWKCDVVFCWMDSPDAYGTLVEIGIAASMGKRIWWAEPKIRYDSRYVQDMWFAKMQAERVYEDAEDAKSALKGFLDNPRHARLNSLFQTNI